MQTPVQMDVQLRRGTDRLAFGIDQLDESLVDHFHMF